MSNQLNVFESEKSVKTVNLPIPKLHFYSDGGHGWLKVPIKLLYNLGIAGNITEYSYMLGNFAYLEEDQDVHTFATALETRYGKFDSQTFWDRIEQHDSSRRSKIRDYPRYAHYSGEELERIQAKRKKILAANKFNQKSINLINSSPESDLDYWIKYYNLS